MGNPSQPQREQLSNLFPGASFSGSTRKRSFDPNSESVVRSNQRKKKAGIKTVRPVTREVVVLSGYTPKVPKSRVRQKLRDDGRIKSLQFTRIMTAEEACEVIGSGFKDKIPDFDEFKYLEIKKDDLELSSKQDLDGNEVIDRRGALYICEKWTTVSINFIVTVAY